MVRKSMLICVLMIALVLSACGGAREDDPQRQALALRTDYLAAEGCTAKLTVQADYGQRVYTYGVDVTVTGGESVLCVTAPLELAGLTARVIDGQSQLEYDGATLETGPLDADGLTPLGAVPMLLECARSGFMDSCAMEQVGEYDTLCVRYRDPERPAGQGRELALWFDCVSHGLVRGEVTVDGYRVIFCEFETFTLN